MGKYFGTDGIRGPAGGTLVNESFFEKLGAAAAEWLNMASTETPPLVVLGRDPRPSGEALMEAAARGLGSGFSCVDAGVLPTPALARLVRTEGAALGIMITASHNPATDNGIKFFTAEGRKLWEEEEAALEGIVDMLDVRARHGRWTHKVGQSALRKRVEGAKAYTGALAEGFPGKMLEGWKVVVDTAHGATRTTAPTLLRHLGAEVLQLGGGTDGAAINQGCGSEHPEAAARAVVESGAQIGFAFDGDGDRLVCIDERGLRLDGDRLLGLIGLDGIRHQWLTGNTLVATVQSNLGLDRALRAEGGRVVRVGVGDRLVSRKLEETGAVFGGENSGHLIFSEHGWSGDGLLSSLMLCQVLRRAEVPLSVLGEQICLGPQLTFNLKVSHKRPIPECRFLSEALAIWEGRLGADGRVMVRYSGTEPLLRILAEAAEMEAAEAAGRALVTAAQKDLCDPV